MTEKRFELTMSGNEVAQYEIIDHSQEILTVYNNLGNVYFSSAMKICELLNSLADENEQLKQQLYYDGDSVCNICKHQYLVETEKYYVAKCDKGHEKCSKEDIKYCEDFKFKELEE